MTPPERKRSAAGRAWRWSFAFLVLAAALIAGLAVWTSYRGTGVPPALVDWAERRANARLARFGTEVSFDGIDLDLRGGLVPVVVIDGLAVSAGGDAETARIGRLEAVLSGGDLLRGRLGLTALRLDRVSLAVRRDRDGALSVQFGAAPLADEAHEADALIARIRDGLSRRPLAGLDEIGITDLALDLSDAASGGQLSTAGGDLRLSRDAAAIMLAVDLGGIATGDARAARGGSVVRATLQSPAPGAPVHLAVRMRGLVPAELAGLAGATPLADLLARLDAPVGLELDADLPQDGRPPRLTGTLSVGQGRLNLPGRVAPVPFDLAKGRIAVSEGGRRVSVTGMRLAAPELDLQGGLELLPELGPGGGLSLERLIAHVRLDRFELKRSTIWEAPLRLDSVSADLRYSRRDDSVELGRMDIGFRGQRIGLTGYLGPAAAPGGRSVALDLEAETLTPGTVLALWPPRLIRGPRTWLQRNLLAGDISDAHAAFRIVPGQPLRPGLGFTFDRAALQVLDGLPPLTDARGRMSIADDALTIAMDRGRMATPADAPIDLTDGVVRIGDIRQANPTLEVSFDAAAGTGPVLALFTLPVFRGGTPAADDADPLTPENATGTVTAHVELGIPLVKSTRFADVALDVAGRLTDFRNDTLVPGHRLSAEAMAIRADKRALVVSGPARIDGMPLRAAYTKTLAPDADPPGGSRVEVEMDVTQGLAESFGVPLTDRHMTGSGRGRLTVDLAPDRAPRLAMRTDLEGVSLQIPELGWSKAANRAGEFALSGRLGSAPAIDRLTVDAPGLAVRGALAFSGEPARVSRIDLGRLRVGGWLDVTAEITPAAPGRALAIAVTGGSVDLRARDAPQPDQGSTGGPPARLDLALDRVTVADGIALTDVAGRMIGGRQGSLRGEVNGRAPVQVELRPGAGGGTALELSSSDAGAVLDAAGLSRFVRGGTLDLRLEPRGSGQRGDVTISDFSLHHTSAMVEFISAISVVGAVEQLRGEGIVFDDARADFTLDRGRLTIASATAEGPSLGVSVDGAVDLGQGRLDLQGVVSPVYFLNRFGTARRGEGLIGVTFRVTGSKSAPRISANPLSALTPGRLRDIFRRPPPGQ